MHRARRGESTRATGEQRPQRQPGKRRTGPDRSHAKATATGVSTYVWIMSSVVLPGRPTRITAAQPSARQRKTGENPPKPELFPTPLFRGRIKSDGSINDSPCSCSCSFVCRSRSSSSVLASRPLHSFGSFLLSLPARLGGGPAQDTGATRRAKVSRRAPAR